MSFLSRVSTGATFRGESGSVGSAVLLAIVGIAVGAMLGRFLGGVLANVLCRPIPGEMNEGCGYGFVLLTFLGVPIGGIVGGTIGALIGKEPRRRPVAEVAPRARRREAPAASWLAGLAGIALLWASMDSWPLVIEGPFGDSLISVGLVSDSEALGAVAGALFLVGGILRQIRSGDRLAAVLVGLGVLMIVVAFVWKFSFLAVLAVVLFVVAFVVRVLRADDRLPIALFAVGIVLAVVAAALARGRITHATDSGVIVETYVAPEFWVAVTAAAAGLLALFLDRASARPRQGARA